MSYRKKLIEVALPLNKISEASAKEKSIRQGHPSTLHLWWSRKPLAACRAVLFASLIDDPSEHPEQFDGEVEQDAERQRLFRLMEDFVDWKNSTNEDLLKQVRAEIEKATDGNPPPVLDLFAGGGSIPLEAQRLGLEAYACDLNPVAVLINKALIEIPPKFANHPPVNPESRQLFSNQGNDWKGAHGLANDIRYYGKWMRGEAEKRIGHLYPKVTLPKEYGGGSATVIAWLWVRTVKCSNPACDTQMPLTSKWWLSSKKGKETWIEPVIDHTTIPPTVSFAVKTGQGKPQDGTVNRQGAKCLVCGASVSFEYVRGEGQAGRIDKQLIAIVAEGSGGRIYLSPTTEHFDIANSAQPDWIPDAALPHNPRDFKTPNYGMRTFGDLFTHRQLVALTTFSDLVHEVHNKIVTDSMIEMGSTDKTAQEIEDVHEYANSVATYLGFGVSKLADASTSLTHWKPSMDQAIATFARQALPMVWDYAESNIFNNAAGDYITTINNIARVVDNLGIGKVGQSVQHDATVLVNGVMQPMISTDPPYYDNIGYADLADFFYLWLRRSLAEIYPELFRTMLVPKAQELVATPYRFEGDKHKAQEFFESGLGEAFKRMRTIQHPDYPLTVYYAFKQSEAEAENEEKSLEDKNGNGSIVVASTGWETMLEGLIRAGFTITGTWPIRTEMMNRNTGQGTNALASSIVLVCRPRPVEVSVATRREFLGALRKELPEALRKLQHGSVAPVDLAQASIGPGMSIYSSYSQVVESDGKPLRVRTALQMINQELDAALAEQEGEYDRETRWAIAWFEQYGMQEGEYGVAETLSKAKNMSVSRLEHTGLVVSKAGKVRLKRREELSKEWIAPNSTVWEVAQRMIYALLEGKGDMGGEIGTANILRQALSLSESVRDLLYRLYTVCERKGWAQEALAYNALVTSWTRITDLAHRKPMEIQQATLL